jgi:hypothetical protein
MRRRSIASSKLAKARSRKTVKRRTTSKDVRRPSSSARPKIGGAQLARERDEALEQLSGASEVLKVIGSSSGDLKPVFQTMLAKAVGLCQAKFGVLWLREGDRFRSVALHNVPVSQRQAREREPLVQFGPHSGSGRAIRTKRAVHIPDLMNDEGYLKRDPRLISLVETGGARAAVFTPLLKDNEVIGILVLFRQEVGPFTDKQMALVENFATQAVIAIENARLLNELRESLQQQTATADVLKVISTSPGELEPVFQAMLENAVRICEAKFGTLFRFEGDAYRAVATHNAPQELMDEYGRHGLRQPTPGGILDRMLRTKQVCHTADYAAESVHGTAAVPAITNVSPSLSHRLPNFASQMLVAFSNMAPNTGWSSPGELEMTLSTSAVAVCCCSDCRNSLSSRVFSTAITAWAAKFSTRSICFFVNGFTSRRYMEMTPTGSLSLNIGMATMVRMPATSTPATGNGLPPR